jgi:hypothetical protein
MTNKKDSIFFEEKVNELPYFLRLHKKSKLDKTNGSALEVKMITMECYNSKNTFAFSSPKPVSKMLNYDKKS